MSAFVGGGYMCTAHLMCVSMCVMDRGQFQE